MRTLRIILGDQLSPTISSLKGYDTSKDIILMCEVWQEATYVKHHKKKIAFLFSAMRHFAQDMKENGYNIIYTKLNDEQNTGSFRGEVARILDHHTIDRIIATHPGEYRVLKDMQNWEKDFAVKVEIRPDDRFLCSTDEFIHWAQNRQQLRMEFFYRDMRKKYHILMDGNEPVGGKWNYDADNRKPLTDTLHTTKPYENPIDSITSEVMELVKTHFSDHFGDLEPFPFAVTRKQALDSLRVFIDSRLEQFGAYQDVMVEGEPWMFHAHISFYLNAGLLLPLECVEAAENAYHEGKAPLNAVEGFIRQILGWREYVRGIYWYTMPDYAEKNFFRAKRTLPDFYWTAKTKMNCLHQCIRETKENAYAHHIQRLMVLGNFALLAGIHPKYVNEWYLIVYADAYEWVEMPNVTGMILFADGGYMASKPYAAGGAYINKMSDYCKNCHYKVTQKNGADACPFNYLYWDFLDRNRDQLKTNPRLTMIYQTYARMDENKKQAIRNDAHRFLNTLNEKGEIQ